MTESKLIQTLKILSLNELEDFNRYIASPFFNQQIKLIQFNQIIFNHAPGFDNKGLIRQEIFKKIFPKEPYKEKKISYLMTDLLKHLNNYISYLHFSNKEYTARLYLLNELCERKADKNFNSLAAELIETIDAETNSSEDYYYNQYLIQSEIDKYQVVQNLPKRKNHLQLKSDSFDIFLIITKLKDFCEMTNRNNIIQADFRMTLMNDLLGHIEKNKSLYLIIPAIIIYRQVLITFKESENETHFSELKILLRKYSQSFRKSEAKVIYGYAQNYCIRKINVGNEKYYSQLFTIYKSLLDEKIIYDGEYLLSSNYKNIVTVAIRTKEYDWTKNFIEQYKTELPPAEQKNAYIYNMSALHVAQREYRPALNLLQKVEFTDVFYHLGAKSMLLKMYYELEETESFYSLCDAFKMYLMRNKLISKSQFENHSNLLKYTRKLFKIRENGNKNPDHFHKLESDVEKKAIANMQWLKEKISELN